MKKVLLLCYAATLFCSCKKDKTTAQENNYTINGVHEISFSDPLANIMSLSVQLAPGGTQETVNLSVEGLPDHMSAKFSTISGIPTFTSVLTFEKADSSEGTYNINIVGTSGTGKRKTYPTKVIIPTLDGIRFDNQDYKVTKLEKSNEFKVITLRSGGDINLVLNMEQTGIPDIAGTYEYELASHRPEVGKVQIRFYSYKDASGGFYPYVTQEGELQKITLKIDGNGEVQSVHLPYVKVYNASITKTLGVRYNK